MEKQVNWYAVEIEVEKGSEEAVEFALNELDSLGNEINNLGKKDAQHLTVIGYFNELPKRELLQKKLTEGLNIYNFSTDAVKNIFTKEIEEQDWLAEWKKHWKPTETDKFIISPPWETVEANDKFIIKIEPNMAFGTGTHETTKLCLKAIENYYRPHMSFFDVGTGTGILSIAVAKLQQKDDMGKGKISGCDVDADSVEIAIENARLNGTSDIEFYVGSVTEDSPKFDFICANVTADIIIPMLPLLVEKSNKFLLLSGILLEQKDSILQELDKYDINNENVEQDGEWVSIRIKK